MYPVLPARRDLSDAFPGFAVSALVAATAQFLSEHYGAPAMLLALLLGLALNFLADEGTRTAAGVALTARSVLRLGVALDQNFGPVVFFGRGGAIVEVLHEQVVALPPLNINLALRLIGESTVGNLLRGYGRHLPANLDEVALAVVKDSRVLDRFEGNHSAPHRFARLQRERSETGPGCVRPRCRTRARAGSASRSW